MVKSLRAYLDGIEYVIPDMDGNETDFNEEAVIAQRTLSNRQIISKWDQAREEFKAAINDIPEDRFPGNLRYPWGDESGSVTRLVEYMIEHDEEHRDEILGVTKKQQN